MKFTRVKEFLKIHIYVTIGIAKQGKDSIPIEVTMCIWKD